MKGMGEKWEESDTYAELGGNICGAPSMSLTAWFPVVLGGQVRQISIGLVALKVPVR